MAVQRYKITQGDTFKLDLSFTLEGEVYDLTDCEISMMIRRYYGSTPLLTLGVGSGIVFTQAEQGEALLTITAAQSAELPLYQPLVYDIELETSAGEFYTVQKGTITMEPDVTDLADA